jgi:hypothetical protein
VEETTKLSINTENGGKKYEVKSLQQTINKLLSRYDCSDEILEGISDIDFDYTKYDMFGAFDKSKFIVTEQIDDYLIDFIKRLNKNEHIITDNSCEGHRFGDIGYISFVLDEEGFEIFWTKVAPLLLRMPLVYIDNIQWKGNDTLKSISVRVVIDEYKDLRWNYVFAAFFKYFNN